MRFFGVTLEELDEAYANSTTHPFVCMDCDWCGSDVLLYEDDCPNCPRCGSGDVAFDEGEVVDALEEWRKLDSRDYDSEREGK